jgi:signal transduction histidine kinase
VQAGLQGRQRSVLAESLGLRAFWLCFAIPAVLTAVYATVLSSQLVAWQTATAYWILTLLLIWLISWLASIIERCEESVEHDSPAIRADITSRRNGELNRVLLAEKRLAHLEQIVIRQHRFVADAAHELRTPLTGLTLIGENVLAKKDISPASCGPTRI